MGCLFQSCYLPAGAGNDPSAPYNEKPDVTHNVEVSMCIDGALKVKAPIDTPFSELKRLATLKAEELVKDMGLVLTSFEVVE